MFKRILIPLDGSQLSERALAPALAIGEQDGAEVILMRVPITESVMVPLMEVYGNYSMRALDEAVDRTRKEAEDYLNSLSKTSTRPNLSLSYKIVEGDPAEAILNTARDSQADLIVMSTHGYSGMTRWILGSVTERVLSGAPCPVLIIRSPQPLKHMLIPLDGSPLAEQALKPGLDIATGLHAAVTLFRVAPEIPMREITHLDERERGLGLRVQDELNEQAETYLHQLADRSAQTKLDLQIVVRHGPAAEAVLNYADAKDVDVVVMATHGRTGLQRWVYGSVTEKVLRNSASFAMLVVRPSA